jgi:hypothetical protein
MTTNSPKNSVENRWETFFYYAPLACVSATIPLVPLLYFVSPELQTAVKYVFAGLLALGGAFFTTWLTMITKQTKKEYS